MAKQSAGILVYRRRPELEFFLIHPGGPYFVTKDQGTWSIPKGEYEDDETPFEAAMREFREETGQDVEGEFHPLRPIVQKSGKRVLAWAVEGNFEASSVVSNTFTLEWPAKSGKFSTFPEVDRADWFAFEPACQKINPAQIAFLDQVIEMLGQV